MNTEEQHAIRVRDCGERIREAHVGVAKTKAEYERGFARAMLESGEKSAEAQKRYANNDDIIFQLRLDVGAAEGELAAARAELRAVEISFETWRTRMANARIERRAYGDR
jgi:hypothetical protein